MFVQIPNRVAAVLLGGGALGVAVTTSLEVLTAPYSSAVSLYALNGVVHMVKVVALFAFAVGMLGVIAHSRDRLGRLGSTAGRALAVATVAGAVPYTVIEASLDPRLTPQAANTQLEAIYADQAWVGILASVALPIIVLSVLTLAVVILARQLLPIWAPISSLLAVPVGVVAMLLAEWTGLELPHPPAWIFLGLATYGAAILAADRAEKRDLHTQPA